MLNPASASAILSALISAIAAACVYPLGRVPDWEDLRPLTWVALTAALVAAGDVTATLEEPEAVYAWTARLQVLFIALHILAWHAYLPGWAKRPVRSLGWALWPLPALGVLALLPGAAYGTGITLRPVPWLGIVYRDPTVTPLGRVVWVLLGAYALWVIVRVVRWGRTGAPYSRAHLACTGALFAMGVHDAVAKGSQSLPTPDLLDFAFYVPITLFGLVTLRRIADNATDYHRLRLGLESAVVERSRALAESQVALTRAERLAALGQVSAGVAHELGSPTAAVAANLQDLARALSGDEREGVRHSLQEARQGVQRIVGLGRQLLLVGGSAGRTGPLTPVSLAEALDPALVAARAQAGTRAAVRVSLPAGLWVRAHQEPLVQVLTSLLLNAVGAIPTLRTGTVSVRAESLAERVRIVVEDDGVGMSEEELRHVFEPFHAAKPPGMGTGLGLVVARGLVEDMQGTLQFESAVGRGTRAVIELAQAEEPTAGVDSVKPPSPPPRASLLVIDDDLQVLRSMERVLGRQHEVHVAAGVREGLAAVAKTSFDLVLCDAMLPSGGGERFWAELLLRDPALTERLVFMTGAAVTGDAGTFLRLQSLPILTKPFDVMEVDEILDQLAHRPRIDRRPAEGSRANTIGRMGKR
jgi:signal transduction histidine kinase/CheY-like chemotaxis protein